MLLWFLCGYPVRFLTPSCCLKTALHLSRHSLSQTASKLQASYFLLKIKIIFNVKKYIKNPICLHRIISVHWLRIDCPNTSYIQHSSVFVPRKAICLQGFTHHVSQLRYPLPLTSTSSIFFLFLPCV